MFTIVGKYDHDESVYNLVPSFNVRRFGCNDPPSYVSRYHCKVLQEAKCQKTGLSLTMGVATVQLNCPENYLRKRTGPTSKKRSRILTQKCTYKCPCPLCREERQRCGAKGDRRKARSSKSEGFSQRFGQHFGLPAEQRRCHASCSEVITSPRGNAGGEYNYCLNNGQGYGYNGECFGDHAGGNPGGAYGNNFEVYGNDFEGYRNNGDCTEALGNNGGECQAQSNDRCNQCCRIATECTCNKRPCHVKLDRGPKDFIHDNAVAVLRQPPRVPPRRKVKVIDYRGTRVLEPECMLDKKSYGKIPAYLYRRKYELYQEAMQAKEAMRIARSNCRELSAEERAMITNGLKKHWAEVFNEFQCLPLNTSTAGLRKRRAALEESLKDLDREIKVFTRTGPLFVADVAKSHYL